MSSQSEVARRRRAVTDLQAGIAQATRRSADARAKAHKAQQSAARTTSTTTAAFKLREFERETKKALDADQQRARLEAQLPGKQKQAFDAETKYARARADEQARSMRRLQGIIGEREAQFRPTLDELVLPGAPSVAASAYDFFISHASEDKREIAQPLADQLADAGVKVWIDSRELLVGDSLRQKIDEGLGASRYGVVILSPEFFAKRWPRDELDGLVAREHLSGEKVILPIWHRVTVDDVARYSPMLAGRRGLDTAVMPLAEIVDELLRVARPADARSH